MTSTITPAAEYGPRPCEGQAYVQHPYIVRYQMQVKADVCLWCVRWHQPCPGADDPEKAKEVCRELPR
jgi:hypothetical protein